ncbi:dolichol kinase [Phymastichus coffea]|uniref:dolichol kinase n=1 Tax=Phymastichus coffea TaxID=108790 RepID=UPI00273A96C2|nr:dolichol kinase [Phymastichus coffea]
MEILTRNYDVLEKRILNSLTASHLRQRTKDCTGLWLGPLIGLSALFTFLKEDSSYSEICLLNGIAGGGLFISCICLYTRLMSLNVSAKDFHVVYFLPAITLSMLFHFVGGKGLLVSVAWGLTVGSLSTWGVIQVMSSFPRAFTLGEATAVTHGIVLFLLSTFTNLPLRYHLPPIHDNDIATVILQVGILYIMLICILCANIPALRGPTKFYSMALGILIILVIPTLHVILDQSPLLWIMHFVFSSYSRIMMVVYWATCLFFATIAIIIQISRNSQATTSVRKIFHILSVIVYVPGFIWDPTFLYLATGVILAVFVALEILRFLHLPPLGGFLQDGFSIFADEKDVLISLTPLYLLCGLSAFLWMPIESMSLLSLMSGVLTIGIGDTAASMVGSTWGKHKWVGTDKSIEGTIACIVAQLIFIFGLILFGYIENMSLLVRSVCSVILVSFIEARTEQVDNLALPFVMYLCLII